MKILEVIESRQWKNSKTGATASIYGSVPYISDADVSNWHVQTCGYTWRLDNGTVGLCRVPAKSREEAAQVMREFNARFAR